MTFMAGWTVYHNIILKSIKKIQNSTVKKGEGMKTWQKNAEIYIN